jgi:hypothetical protein
VEVVHFATPLQERSHASEHEKQEKRRKKKNKANDTTATSMNQRSFFVRTLSFSGMTISVATHCVAWLKRVIMAVMCGAFCAK